MSSHNVKLNILILFCCPNSQCKDEMAKPKKNCARYRKSLSMVKCINLTAVVSISNFYMYLKISFKPKNLLQLLDGAIFLLWGCDKQTTCSSHTDTWICSDGRFSLLYYLSQINNLKCGRSYIKYDKVHMDLSHLRPAEMEEAQEEKGMSAQVYPKIAIKSLRLEAYGRILTVFSCWVYAWYSPRGQEA